MNKTLTHIVVSIFVAVFTAGCVSTPLVTLPNPQPRPTVQAAPNAEIQRANQLLQQGKEVEAADAYFKASQRSPSPLRERLMLQAAEVATYIKDAGLARRYLAKLAGMPLDAENQARQRYVKASIALIEDNPDYALNILPQQRGQLSTSLWNKIERLRKQANSRAGGTQKSTNNQNRAAPLPQQVSRVAVLLPLNGKLSVLGNTILQGMQATQTGFSTDTRIKTYDVSNTDVWTQYQKAVADGADVVIGPLDKRKLQTLASKGNLPRPVIGLNRTNEQGVRYASIYQFGLSPEDEAYQIAQFAASRGHRRAALMYPDSSWGQRLAQAFKSSYSRSGGQVVTEEPYPTSARTYSSSVQRVLSSGADMIFLAASPTQARSIRPMIQHKGGANMPVYATSHVYSGLPDSGKNVDLDGIVYTEIPYILETSGSGTQLIEGKYPRLYALGADSLVIAKNISTMVNTRQPLGGKTGHISIDGRNVMHRKLNLATFVNGQVQSLGR